jgi:UTP-glucose-1-phosphate uridylyltransferase
MVTDVVVDSAPLDPGARRVRLLVRYILPGDVFGELAAVVRSTPAGSEADGLAVLQGLARRGELAGVTTPAVWYEVGLPEGYRSAVADFPAQA